MLTTRRHLTKWLLAVTIGTALGAATPFGHSSSPPADAAAPAPRRFTFERLVANIEYVRLPLRRTPRASTQGLPKISGEAWFGRIMRRLPGEGTHDSDHYVPFAAEYDAGLPRRAWCDVDLDADLADEEPVRLFGYPGKAGTRSFLVDLSWLATWESRAFPIDWKVRVVLEPGGAENPEPTFRVQRVYGMVGNVILQGRAHRAVLFDGNGDGLYTKAFGDGVFIDRDDDLRFTIDPMSPDFGPMAVPFPMEDRDYEILSVDAEGASIAWVEKGAATQRGPLAEIGAPAPDFTFRDVDGRIVRLADYRGRYVAVYFWASWCGTCAAQASEIRALYERLHAKGFEILGVSYDTDREAMVRFRAENRHSWPTSFSGRMLWEDPIGRLYQARGAGEVCLVGPSGRLIGRFTDLKKVESVITGSIPPAPAKGPERQALGVGTRPE